ncbi:MAG TPA: lysylphosphatidylglycerol synthase domain-containing protein [Gemmatimonadaceae bacterium]|jgi:hypothetical protein
MSSPKTTRYALRGLQVAIAVAALAFAFRALSRQWRDSSAQLAQVHPDWSWLALSGMIFLATYAVLLETWREVLRTWSSRLGYVSAARIWTVSNLGRYVPGKVWQIGAMGLMAERAGVSPIAATGSAILNVVVNLVAGFLIAAAFGWPLLNLPQVAGGRGPAIMFALGTVVILAVLPRALPPLVRRLSRVTGRDFGEATFPAAAIVISVVGNLVAWVLYGTAFATFARGIIGSTHGPITAYIAVYALSYLVGYLVLFVPAGVGFREAAMIALLPAAHLATPAQAAVLAVTSRLWLTVLEIAPGALFLTFDGLRRRPREE